MPRQAKVAARPLAEGVEQRIHDGTRATYHRGDHHVATIIALGAGAWWWTTALGGSIEGTQAEAEDAVRGWLV